MRSIIWRLQNNLSTRHGFRIHFINRMAGWKIILSIHCRLAAFISIVPATAAVGKLIIIICISYPLSVLFRKTELTNLEILFALQVFFLAIKPFCWWIYDRHFWTQNNGLYFYPIRFGYVSQRQQGRDINLSSNCNLFSFFSWRLVYSIS